MVARGEQALEQVLGLGDPARERVVVGQPEAAGEERPLRPGQPVGAGLGAVAKHEAVPDQVLLDGGDGGQDPWIRRGQEAEVRKQQHAGVQRVAAVRLREGSDARIEAARADLGVDALAERVDVRQHGAALVPPMPSSSMTRAARSTATQAMTLEWVKWRRPPPTSQN